MKKLFGEFKEFAVRGNVIDLAIGIIVGAGFNAVVNSLVKNIVMPPIGLALNRVDFSNLYVSLTRNQFSTFAEAQRAGVPTLNYGIFLNDVISFLITAFVVFLAVHWINKLRRRKESKDEKIRPTKECPHCYTTIDARATKCPQCTTSIA